MRPRIHKPADFSEDKRSGRSWPEDGDELAPSNKSASKRMALKSMNRRMTRSQGSAKLSVPPQEVEVLLSRLRYLLQELEILSFFRLSKGCLSFFQAAHYKI